MKTSVLIILTVMVLIVGALAVMNNACRSAQHAWCAPRLFSVWISLCIARNRLYLCSNPLHMAHCG